MRALQQMKIGCFFGSVDWIVQDGSREALDFQKINKSSITRVKYIRVSIIHIKI